MVERYAVRLGPAQETLVIPLYGRAVESAKRRPLLRDPKSVEMVRRLDYDFAKFGRGPSLFGSVLRGEIVDAWVRDFLAAHPDGTVVEIGAGLNTRYERLDNGRAHWLEFDLPDTMALRRRFFAETPRRLLLDASVTEPAWIAAAHRLPAPYCLVSEAVLIYLAGALVVDTLRGIGSAFPGATLVMDTWTRFGIATTDYQDAMRKMAARYDWYCDDPGEIDGWGVGLRRVESRRLTRPPAAVRLRMSGAMRRLLALADRTPMARMYVLSRFDVVEPGPGQPPKFCTQ